MLDAVQRWANDDLRSLNAQIEFLLRRALRAEGRLKPAGDPAPRRGGEARTRPPGEAAPAAPAAL